MIIRIALALAVLLAGAPAFAQEGSPQAQQEARALATRARRDYDAHRYGPALERYQAAYAAYPAPGLLFNIGQCQRELGHHDLAVQNFEQYLAARPDAANRAIVLDLIAESRARLGSGQTHQAEQELARARHELEEAERGSAEQVATARGELEEAERALAEAQAREQALQRAIADAPRPEPPVYETWWFWTVLVGVAALVAGGISIGVVVGTQEPGLPFGSLGTIDAR